MMIIFPTKHINMHCDARSLRKALECMWDHLTAQITDLLPSQTELHHAIRSIREIHHSACQGLVERCISVPEPQ